MRRPRAALTGLAGIAFLLAVGLMSRPLGAGVASPKVDRAISANLGGKPCVVEWYHTGPYPPTSPGNPPLYVRGVVVRLLGSGRSILGRWESPRTSLVAFYPKLDDVWPIGGPQGGVISAAVQFGGRVLALYMLRLEGNRLKAAGQLAGADFSISLIRSRLVVKADSGDYSRVPDLYVWQGGQFRKANQDFPEYYMRLGSDYARGMEKFRAVPPEALVQDCELALQAYRLARKPALGRSACLEAKERISSGWGIRRGVSRMSDNRFEQEKKHAVRRLEQLLAGG